MNGGINGVFIQLLKGFVYTYVFIYTIIIFALVLYDFN